MLRALILSALVLSPVSAFADVPDIDDATLKPACDSARAMEQCPSCTCQMRTSTLGVAGLDERTSDLLIGLVVDVAGKRADGTDFSAAHVLLGTTSKLTRVARLATSQLDGDNVFRQYDVTAGRAEMTMCPGDCDFQAVGVVHPFEVKTTVSVSRPLDDGTLEDKVTEETRLVVCFEGEGGLMCASSPLALEERVERPSMAPGMKHKVLSREGYKRTWKFGRSGDVAFGKATGKLASRLTSAAAHKVAVVDLDKQADGKRLD